ncbi:MAG: GNAT family N-acetyltransferase [Bacteroidota bacterium]
MSQLIELDKKISIKKCNPEDIPQLIKVATQSYREHYTYLWQDRGEQYIAIHFNSAQLALELSHPDAYFFLVLDKDVAVGFFKLNLLGNQVLELERIYLLQAVEGKGIGRIIVQFTENFAKKYQRKTIELRTMKKGKAEGFYLKMGFEIVGESLLEGDLIIEAYKRMHVMKKNV